ncbi:MAG TPA: cupin domain-containing protein [Acidimicrobiales bacterium]|nr:cupin domain-containing protein [Acidimicrobiales bacterium]
MGDNDRIFVRALTSEDYGLKEFRRRQLAAPRVREASGDDHDSISEYAGSSYGGDANTSNEARGITSWDHIEPGDDPFLTQSLQVYFHDFPPNSSNRGHGHQNEAAFYVLDGKGYEIHDGQRYDWEKGDFYVVHTDSVHRHFNPYDEPATVMIVKAKPMWMFLGLVQQGKSYNPVKEGELPNFSERVEWGQIWTDGVIERKKVVGRDDAPWEMTPLGKIRVFSSPERTDVRMFSVDAFELEIPAGSHSGKSWKMADEILHIVSGSGYSLHWQVEAEIDDRYYARIAKEPTRYEFKQGDTLYVPQNTITQHFASDGQQLLMFSGQNRVFKHLGYDKVAYLENAPEYDGVKAERGAAVSV